MRCSAGIVALFALASGSPPSARAQDATDRLRAVAQGAPRDAVWDLRRGEGRVVALRGTCGTEGAAERWAFDPRSGLFERDPGERAPFPGALRVEDLATYRGRRYAAVAMPKGGIVAASQDGRTWKTLLTLADARPRAFIDFGERFYVSATGNRFFRLSGAAFNPAEEDLFPTIQEKRGELFVARSGQIGHQTVYLAARDAPGGDWRSRRLFAAPAPDDVRELLLPGKPGLRDLLVRGGKLYLLVAPGEGRVAIFATKNLSVWEEALAFASTLPVRSFEILGGDFYFGLGCPEAGNAPAPAAAARPLLLRIKAKDWQVGSPSAWVY
jgi:hypothetical protein